MFTIQLWLALLLCLVLTEAQEDSRFDRTRCDIKNTAIHVQKKDLIDVDVEECRDKCGSDDQCQMWSYDEEISKDDGRCRIFFLARYRLQKERSNNGSIHNCLQSKIEGDVVGCGQQKHSAASIEIKVIKKITSNKCEQDCLNNHRCLVWAFTIPNNKCQLAVYKDEYKNGATFGMKYCSEPLVFDECTMHRTLNDPSRSVKKYKDNFVSDYIYESEKTKIVTSYDWQGDGWYRLTGTAGYMIPEYPPNKYHCGTGMPGWLDGRHPTDQGQTKVAKFCFNRGPPYSKCHKWDYGKITHCGSFYVYYLPGAGGEWCTRNTQQCVWRYCTTN